MKDFRFISLVGSLYKILAKAFVNKLKKVITKVVKASKCIFGG